MLNSLQILLMSVRRCGRHTGEQYVNIVQARVMYSLVLIGSKCDDLKVRQVRFKVL